MPPPRPSRLFSNHRAFTLVELMVTVAIVGLLAALIFPAFRSTQTRAKQIKSLANLRAIGGGLGLYLGENQNMFPASCNSAFNGGFWTESLAPYLPPAITITKFDTGTKFQISPVFVDPLLPNNRHHPLGDYGANSDVFYGPTGWPITTTPVSVSALEGRLSKTVAVMTAEDATSLTPPCGSWFLNRKGIVTIEPQSWTGSRPGTRGTGSYLCLFTDLHTEIIQKDDFQQRRGDLLSIAP